MGARFAPAAVRTASQMTSFKYSPWFDKHYSKFKIYDAGDAAATPFDIMTAMNQVYLFTKRLWMAAAPILIAGIATSSVGAATNIGTSLVEKILNSRQIKEMNAAFERDKDITQKLESQMTDIKQYKQSSHLQMLLNHIKTLLGANHLLLTMLQGILLYDMSSSDSLAAGLLAQKASIAIVSATGKEEESCVSKPAVEEKTTLSHGSRKGEEDLPHKSMEG